MVKHKAYTLLELTIVIIIMALVAVLAIPASARYGNSQAYDQKAAEVKELMNQAYTLSRNPEKDVLTYSIAVNSGGTEFVLKRCFQIDDPSTMACSESPRASEVVARIALLESEIIQSGAYLNCSTDPQTNCVTSGLFSFRDDKVTSSVSYAIQTPFQVISNRTD